MDWTKIGVLIIAGGFLIFFMPRLFQAAKESPKPKKGDWQSVIIPIGLVIVFVILLISMVKR